MPRHSLPAFLPERKKPGVSSVAIASPPAAPIENLAVTRSPPHPEPATGPATATARREESPCCCSISCSRCPPASRPITTWSGCRRSPSRECCRSARPSPSWSRSQRARPLAECSASGMRRAAGSSTPCGRLTEPAPCGSRCKPPPCRRWAASPTGAFSSSTSPSRRSPTEPVCAAARSTACVPWTR